MGTVVRRGSSYRARYRGPDGRERNKSFALKRDAERWLAEQLTNMSRGEYIDPKLSKVMFGGFIEGFDGYWKARTDELNGGIIRNHLLPRFERVPVAKISTRDVKALVTSLLDEGKSPSTVRNAVKCLSVVMNAAIDDGLIRVNPCQRVKLPRETTREMMVLDHQQVADVATVIGSHYAPLVYTAAYVGLRWGELAGLPPSNINWLRRTITVDRQMVEVNGTLRLDTPKSKRSVRTVSVPNGVMEILSTVDMTGDHVFRTVRGRPLRRNNFRKTWVAAVRESGCPTITFHELRHTAASLAIEAGAHPKTICDRLGHASISITMDRYGHLFPSQDEALATALDRRLVVNM